MALDFKVKDILHNIVAKFFPAYLPNAKKKYTARAVMQQHLDIHGIASKASIYNITTSPKVIEEGLTAGCELIYYLVGDGYKIDTPIVHLGASVPGEYDGYETHLPQGIYPAVLARVNNNLREYVKNNVKIIFDGVEENNGLIAVVIDKATGEEDATVTINNLITIYGIGLKIESDTEHANQVGLFFVDNGGIETKADIIAVNEPKTLKTIVPSTLTASWSYSIRVRTQSGVKGNAILKTVREITSDFNVIAQN
jgi:hypothetical protein